MNVQERQELTKQVHNCNGDGVTDCMSLHTYAAQFALQELANVVWVDEVTFADDIDKTIAVLQEYKREVVLAKNPQYAEAL